MAGYVDRKRNPWNCDGIPTVLFIIGSLLFEEYVFVFTFLANLLQQKLWTAILIFIVSHFFILMMSLFYRRAIGSGPGYIKPNINESFPNVEDVRMLQERVIKHKFKYKSGGDTQLAMDSDIEANPQLDERARILAEDPIAALPEMGYCFKCNRLKLPRAHHCKQCGRCVLRMDHHCPWVGNCVGLYNQKFFIGFLGYAICSALCVILPEFFLYFLDSEFSSSLLKQDQMMIQINTATTIALLVAVSFLFAFQIYAGAYNVTTVEYHHKGIIQRNPYDKKDIMRNLEDIFGTDHSTWIWPVDPPLDSEEDLFLLRHY